VLKNGLRERDWMKLHNAIVDRRHHPHHHKILNKSCHTQLA